MFSDAPEKLPRSSSASRVDVIVSAGDAQVLAIKRVTTALPIVIAEGGDPVTNGLAESLASPGGNVTGLSAQINDTAGKHD